MFFCGKTIKSSDTVKLLRNASDKNINFKRHIENICRKANDKRKALFRIRKFLKLELVQVSAQVYISSYFRYSLLILMLCGNINDNRTAETHYRTPRIIYDTKARSFEEVLGLSGGKIHTQSLQILKVEVYKCLNNISPPFIFDYFKQKNIKYNLRTT